MMHSTLGVDVGGTTVKALWMSANGTALGQWRAPTPIGDATGAATMAVIDRLVRSASEAGNCEPIGLVVPGEVDERAGVCLNAVNLGWKELPVRGMAEHATGKKVAFGHDVRAGALAESTLGAGVATTGPVLFIPVGTGLASALVIEGQPQPRQAWGGEDGQDVIGSGPNAGRRYEEICSAGGIAKRARSANAQEVLRRAGDGDPLANAVWSEAIEALAELVAASIKRAVPSMVIIGGGLALAGDRLFVPLRDHVRLRGLSTPIVPSTLGDRAAMFGAALLARRDPSFSARSGPQ